MAPDTYRITHPGGTVEYVPATGLLRNTTTHETRWLPRRVHNGLNAFVAPGTVSCQRRFRPVCLTLHLGNSCNLACRYCYANPDGNRGGVSRKADALDSDAVSAAARFVAECSAARREPLVVGFHGGNEPLLRWETVAHTLAVCRREAAGAGVEFFPVCTTNGVISEDTALWAARTFAAMTLSWDGPPDIHDRFRVHRDGSPTSDRVAATAAILTGGDERPRFLRVRATVTGHSAERLPEITEFFHERGLRHVEYYPVFRGTGAHCDGISPPGSVAFLSAFLAARSWAATRSMLVTCSACRPLELHTRYCAVYQDNLTLTPTGRATACFRGTDDRTALQDHLIYGRADGEAKRFALNGEALGGMHRRLRQPPDQCTDCFNRYHCPQGCPELCPLDAGYDPRLRFDCTLPRLLGLALLLDAAGVPPAGAHLDGFVKTLAEVDVSGLHIDGPGSASRAATVRSEP